jgi:Holliday junction resolvase YEN1
MWIVAVCDELVTNSHQLLDRRYPGIAHRLPSEFPSLATIRLYTHPRTNDYQDVAALQLRPKVPNVYHLSRVCQQLFTFGREPEALQRKFLDVVWTGLGMRLVIHEALLHDSGDVKDPGEPTIL